MILYINTKFDLIVKFKNTEYRFIITFSEHFEVYNFIDAYTYLDFISSFIEIIHNNDISEYLQRKISGSGVFKSSEKLFDEVFNIFKNNSTQYYNELIDSPVLADNNMFFLVYNIFNVYKTNRILYVNPVNGNKKTVINSYICGQKPKHDIYRHRTINFMKSVINLCNSFNDDIQNKQIIHNVYGINNMIINNIYIHRHKKSFIDCIIYCV